MGTSPTTILTTDRSAIVLRDVTWSAPDGSRLLQGVSFALGFDRAALVGKNGSGKTTLLKMIVGDLKSEAGSIEVNARIGYLPQALDTIAVTTVGNVLGIQEKLDAIRLIESGEIVDRLYEILADDWDIAERAAATLQRLGLEGIGFDRSTVTLSGGELTRLSLAGLLMREPEFLILDEPTNNLDQVSRSYLYDVLRSWRSGCLVVSHDRTLLNLMNTTLELTDGRVRQYGGGFDLFREIRGIEDRAAAREVATAEQLLKRERIEAQRSRERQARRASSGARNRKSAGQAKIILGVWKESSQKTGGRLSAVHERRIEDAQSKLRAARERLRSENILKLDIRQPTIPSGKLVVRLQDVAYKYPRAEGHPVIDQLTFTITGPERVAITGANGSGKTTLMRLIQGDLMPTSGNVFVGVKGVAFVPQSTSSLRPGEDVLSAFQRLSGVASPDEARQQLSKCLFFGDTVFRSVDTLSGGERIRLCVGAALSQPDGVELVLIDEPTNHLDLDSIEQLESALQEYHGALVVVSHDQSFLDAIGIDRLLELSQGKD